MAQFKCLHFQKVKREESFGESFGDIFSASYKKLYQKSILIQNIVVFLHFFVLTFL